VVEKYIPVIEADVIKNYGFVHVDVESSREKLDEVKDRFCQGKFCQHRTLPIFSFP